MTVLSINGRRWEIKTVSGVVYFDFLGNISIISRVCTDNILILIKRRGSGVGVPC